MVHKGWIAIVNPVSGGGKGTKRWPKIKQLLDKAAISHEVVFTEAQGHAGQLLEAYLQKGHRHFILVGGDGTYHEVANALMRQDIVATHKVTFAMFPTGTGNDWIRTHHPKASYADIVQMMEEGHTYLQDIGYAHLPHEGATHKRYFFNLAGLGFDAYVAANFLDEKNKHNSVAYLWALLKGLTSFDHLPVKIQFEGTEIETSITLLAIGICRFLGGGMMITPKAIPNDGLLDLTIVKDLSKLGIIGQLPSLYKGSFLSHPKVASHQVKELTVIADDQVFIQLDGEIIGHCPVTFGIVPSAMRVVVSSGFSLLDGA